MLALGFWMVASAAKAKSGVYKVVEEIAKSLEIFMEYNLEPVAEEHLYFLAHIGFQNLDEMKDILDLLYEKVAQMDYNPLSSRYLVEKANFNQRKESVLRTIDVLRLILSMKKLDSSLRFLLLRPYDLGGEPWRFYVPDFVVFKDGRGALIRVVFKEDVSIASLREALERDFEEDDKQVFYEISDKLEKHVKAGVDYGKSLNMPFYVAFLDKDWKVLDVVNSQVFMLNDFLKIVFAGKEDRGFVDAT